MKICFLTKNFNNLDGWGRYSVSLVSHLQKKGIECVVLIDRRAQNIEMSGVEIKPILYSFYDKNKKLLLIYFDYFKAKKYIKDCQAIHSLVEPYAPLAIMLARGKKPYFITAHGTYTLSVFQNPVLRVFYEDAFKQAKKVFCVSSFTEKKLLEKIKLNNTQVINNGVDLDKFKAASKDSSKNGIATLPSVVRNDTGKEKIILSVGILRPRKGYHISIPAVGQVAKKFKNLKYYIVGKQEDENYFNQLKNLVKKHNLDDNIKFLQDISDQELAKLYQRADLFLLTPVNVKDSFEGFGLVYLEANACGLSVIGSKGCGAEDAVVDGETGFLVRQNDVNQAAEAIIKLLSNSQLAQQMGRQGRQRTQDFSWDKVVDKYLGFYFSSARTLAACGEDELQ